DAAKRHGFLSRPRPARVLLSSAASTATDIFRPAHNNPQTPAAAPVGPRQPLAATRAAIPAVSAIRSSVEYFLLLAKSRHGNLLLFSPRRHASLLRSRERLRACPIRPNGSHTGARPRRVHGARHSQCALQYPRPSPNPSLHGAPAR